MYSVYIYEIHISEPSHLTVGLRTAYVEHFILTLFFCFANMTIHILLFTLCVFATIAMPGTADPTPTYSMGYIFQNTTERNNAPVLSVDLSAGTIPQRYDWRSKGVVTPVKEQGHCGSCWAFSAVESVESALAITTGEAPVALSVEQILVCCKTMHHSQCSSCMGGDPVAAYRYIQENSTGLDADSDYPYDPTTNPFVPPPCKAKANKPVAKVNSWAYAVPRCVRGNCSAHDNKEIALMAVVAQHGPVSICIDAEHSFINYKSGIYNGPCSSAVIRQNHCVSIVGYDAQEQYWLVRNSWGTSWGEDGYIRMAMGSNLCGITNEATIANVTKA